jgi:hypothetical protein
MATIETKVNNKETLFLTAPALSHRTGESLVDSGINREAIAPQPGSDVL